MARKAKKAKTNVDGGTVYLEGYPETETATRSDPDTEAKKPCQCDGRIPARDQLRKRIPAVLWTIFSVFVVLIWPHLHKHISWLWWNYSILFIGIGMVCLFVSRFFGVQQPFVMPETKR